MKFLHTGDLHLDSAFASEGVLNADARRAEQRDVLRRIFDCAKEEKCDLILIAGDLFDSVYVTPETKRAVLELFASSPCPVVIAPGNHDPYTEGSFYRCAELPEHVYVFTSSELQCFVFEDLRVKVFGYAFLSAALNHSPLNAEAPVEEDGYLHLLCAHADLASPISRYAPVTVGDLVTFGIDYAALGHIHQPPEPQRVGKTEVRYCGFAEGRSFDELGEGGVWIVNARAGEPWQIERRIVSHRRYEEAEVSVDGCEEQSHLLGRLASVIGSFGEIGGTHLRLTLTGATESEWIDRLNAEIKEYESGLASLTLRNETVPVMDGEALAQDVTIRGALYRSLYLSLIDDDPAKRRTAARALQIGLAAIEGRSIPTEEWDA